MYFRSMRYLAFCLIALVTFISACNAPFSGSESVRAESTETFNTADPAPVSSEKRTPVLVELFTSEGCSSCPPADRGLILLEKQVIPNTEVIALEFHVDYWNYLGWKDEFSSRIFSDRQESYGDKFQKSGVYTPQMVVDGTTEFVGNNVGKAQSVIAESAKNAKTTIDAEVASKSAAEANLTVKIEKLPETKETVSVMLAVTESNLSSNVSRGENSGSKLDHTAVVRQISSLGNLAANANSFTSAIKIQQNWKRKDLNAVIFLQGTKSGKVFGVTKIALS